MSLQEASYPAVLTTAEAAVILGVSKFTVEKMCRDGRLPRLPIRRTRIPTGSVLATRDRMADETRAARIEAARKSMATCNLVPHYHGPRTCDGCGTALVGFQRRWCSEACSDRWWGNHAWGFARPMAIESAGGSGAPCARCGVTVGYLAEVNHIVPRDGQGYGRGCHHHQSNLEVLCHDCHSVETTRQLRERRAARGNPVPVPRIDAPMVPLWGSPIPIPTRVRCCLHPIPHTLVQCVAWQYPPYANPVPLRPVSAPIPPLRDRRSA